MSLPLALFYPTVVFINSFPSPSLPTPSLLRRVSHLINSCNQAGAAAACRSSSVPCTLHPAPCDNSNVLCLMAQRCAKSERQVSEKKGRWVVPVVGAWSCCRSGLGSVSGLGSRLGSGLVSKGERGTPLGAGDDTGRLTGSRVQGPGDGVRGTGRLKGAAVTCQWPLSLHRQCSVSAASPLDKTTGTDLSNFSTAKGLR